MVRSQLKLIKKTRQRSIDPEFRDPRHGHIYINNCSLISCIISYWLTLFFIIDSRSWSTYINISGDGKGCGGKLCGGNACSKGKCERYGDSCCWNAETGKCHRKQGQGKCITYVYSSSTVLVFLHHILF